MRAGWEPSLDFPGLGIFAAHAASGILCMSMYYINIERRQNHTRVPSLSTGNRKRMNKWALCVISTTWNKSSFHSTFGIEKKTTEDTSKISIDSLFLMNFSSIFVFSSFPFLFSHTRINTSHDLVEEKGKEGGWRKNFWRMSKSFQAKFTMTCRYSIVDIFGQRREKRWNRIFGHVAPLCMYVYGESWINQARVLFQSSEGPSSFDEHCIAIQNHERCRNVYCLTFVVSNIPPT